MSKALDLLFFFGRPFSPIYSLLMKSREKLYYKNIFNRQSLEAPVISIGNLVLGGTGKTPTVQHVAQLLLDQGYHPAIVSRGYGGKSKAKINIVSDGAKILLTPAQAGDEPYMLAQSLPGVPVLTGKRRKNPCCYAIDKLQCDVIILDDGFQHLGVKRDLDIVLFDSTVLAGNSRVCPGGPMREPISALKRSHAFLLTGQNESNKERTQKFSALLQQRFPNKPVFISALHSCKLYGPNGAGAEEDILKLAPKLFFGFCGIANPARFEKTLVNMGIQLVHFLSLNDHTPYSQSMVSQLCKKAIECGAESMVTTEKDFVKLEDFKLSLPLYVLKVQHKLEPSFDNFLLNALRNRQPQS